MKKKIYFTFIILQVVVINFSLSAQNAYEADKFEFPEDYEETGTYTAQDYISISPEFNYTLQADNLYLETNPFLIIPPEGGLTGGPNGVGTGVVGTIEGNFSVSPSGAAIYNIPLDLPPGIAGMTPEISLTYNSQGGYGILGPKWAISGISTITRAPQTYYYTNDEIYNYPEDII